MGADRSLRLCGFVGVLSGESLVLMGDVLSDGIEFWPSEDGYLGILLPGM